MTYTPCCDNPEHGLQPTAPESRGWAYGNRPTGTIRPPYVATQGRDLAAERPPEHRPHCTGCGEALDPKWCDPNARAGGTPIAIGLLRDMLADLKIDHYDDNSHPGTCDGCDKAAAVKAEIVRLT